MMVIVANLIKKFRIVDYFRKNKVLFNFYNNNNLNG